jgi:hypothetical protein
VRDAFPVSTPPLGGLLFGPFPGTVTGSQRLLECRCIGEAIVRALGEAPQHDRLEIGRKVDVTGARRRADEDLNPDTSPDVTWTPLLATPPYPSYAGNAACLSAASARALQLGFGRDDVTFSITWPRTGGLPMETRDFSGFWQLADQQARSRIHGGIHFQFESEASQAACVKVAEFAHARFMKPQRH